MTAVRIACSSLEFKNQLRDGIAPIEACAFNTPRREFLAVDASALRVWSLTREIKSIRKLNVCSGPAIAAFCVERDDIYIVVYQGKTRDKTVDAEAALSPSEWLIVYNGRLRVLSQISPCECEVMSASFHHSTGALLVAGVDGTLRAFHITSRKQMVPSHTSRSTTAVKHTQVTVKEIWRLAGPIKPVPMTLLVTDNCSGLVVGINGLHTDQDKLRWIALSVVEAHGASPVLDLCLLRAKGTECAMASDEPCTDYADADEWSIVSGGGDGIVAHWSLRGFVGDGSETRQQDGAILLKIGAYEVARRSSAAIATSTGRGYHREGTSVNRSPSVTHAMVVHFPACMTSSLIGEETTLVRRLDKTSLPGEFDNVVRPSEDGGSRRSKTMCLAISGGLVSVLELVEPLWQFGKAPVKEREFLRMARTPRWWDVGALIVRRANAGNYISDTMTSDVKAEAKEGGASKRVRDSFAAENDDHRETIVGHGNRAGFVVMSEGGWLGWYHGFYGNFDLVSQIELTSPEMSSNSPSVRTQPTCFVPFIAAPGKPRRSEHGTPSYLSMKMAATRGPLYPSSRFRASALEKKIIVEEKVIVGYSDGSIAITPIPLLSMSSVDCGRQDPARVATRRMGRVTVGEEVVVEAGITALCSLSAALVVAGDSNGRMALWTTSASPSTGRPLLWEDEAAHSGPVVGIQRVREPPPLSPPGSREWVVSTGSGGDVRVWKLASPSQGDGARANQSVRLEFCTAFLTSSPISSFSCVLVSPPRGTCGGPEHGGVEADNSCNSGVERTVKRQREKREGQQLLYCVTGLDNGVVQAWETGLSAGRKVTGQPVWSQKVHTRAVTIMDACRVETWEWICPEICSSTSIKHRQSPSVAARVRQDRDKQNPTYGWLIMSGSLDRSLCVFQARYGEALRMLRRLNLGSTLGGLACALFVELHAEDGTGCHEASKQIGIVITCGDGKITRLGFKYTCSMVRHRNALEEADKGMSELRKVDLRRASPCEDMLKSRKPTTKHGHHEAQPSSLMEPGPPDRWVSPCLSYFSAEGGYSGDLGRWQQRLGVLSVDGDTGNDKRDVTVSEVLRDRRMHEIFTARGRHKKSPVLACEVKAIIKAWSPGLIEGCSLEDVTATLDSSRGSIPISFERVCEIAAALTACKNVTPPGSYPRPTTLGRHPGKDGGYNGNQGAGHRAPTRPPRYQDMAKFKTRFEYNSMGEKVVMRTAVKKIDAYAARCRQRPPKQEPDQKQRLFEVEETDSQRPVSGQREDNRVASCQCDLVVSRSLSFDFPDFSSIGSRLGETIFKEKEPGNGTRPSRASSKCFGNVPAGLQRVWSRKGSDLFGLWPESYDNHGENLFLAGTASSEDTFSESECVRTVRDLLDTMSSTAVAALIACRRRGRCSSNVHGLVAGDTIRLYQRDDIFTRTPGEEHLEATETTNTEPETALTASFSNGTLEHNDGGSESVPPCAGLIRNQEEKEKAEASGGWASNSRQTSTPWFEFCDPICPVTKVEPLGVVVYGQFRRRYGLQHTAEKRLAAMVGSAVEYARSAAVLRLFARMLGVSAGTKLGGHWPYQTRAEDAHQGLDASLARLVYFARDWLTVRGFMTTDGPWIGNGVLGGSSAGGSHNACWQKVIVSRTHAAMCAAALLKPDWGPGHRIMEAAEQAILDLPTVRPSGSRATGRRGLEHWSEFVDGEEFLEELLLLVLRSRELSENAEKRLFDAKTVERPASLLASARGISTDGKQNFARSGVQEQTESLQRASSLASFRESGAANGVVGHVTKCTVLKRDPSTRHRLSNRVEELRQDGGLLKKLKALLDSFIREDPQRSGTLNADVFKRVLCKGHGGLWGDQGATKRVLGASQANNSESTTEPESTRAGASTGLATGYANASRPLTENEAVLALVQRFKDVYDGHVCYLDVWMTLFHGVFRSGQIIPVVDLPNLCETQLRGADSEHWEALLEYLEAVGTCYMLPASNNIVHGWDTHHDNGGGHQKSGILDHAKQLQQWSGAAACSRASTASTVGICEENCLANWKSAPNLRVLRSTIEGGAPHLHPVLEANFGPALNIRRRSVSGTSRKCEDWPQAGWGPGSLTVSRPPQTAKSHAFVVPPTALTTALKIIHGVDRQARTTQPEITRDGKRRTEGGEGGDMVAFVREGRYEHTSLVWVDSTTTARLVSRKEEELHQLQKDNGMEKILNVQEERTRCDDFSREGEGKDECQAIDVGTNSNDRSGPRKPQDDDTGTSSDIFDLSMPGSMLLYNLDCGTLESPSPEPPSKDRLSTLAGSEALARERAATRGQQAKKKREKRIMTSIYVRCPFLVPVKSKHTYRVPRGGKYALLTVPLPQDPYATSMALHLYSPTVGSEAREFLVNNKSEGTMLQEGWANKKGWHRLEERSIKSGPEGSGGDDIDTTTLTFNAGGFALEGKTVGDSDKWMHLIASGLDKLKGTAIGEADQWLGSSLKRTTGHGDVRQTIKGERRGQESRGDSDDSSSVAGKGSLYTKQNTQKKIIEAMVSKQVAKQHSPAEMMKRLISEKKDRKQSLKDEEELARKVHKKADQKAGERLQREVEARRKALATRRANQKAEECQRRELEASIKALAKRRVDQEAQERHRTELDARRNAIAKRKVDLEETNRRLEEERLKREAERELTEQVNHCEAERILHEEETKYAKVEGLAREEARLTGNYDEGRRSLEEAILMAEEDKMQRLLHDQNNMAEERVKKNMDLHDEDSDNAIKANLVAVREGKRREREAEAARKAEMLKRTTVEAKRKHDCLMLSKADDESRLWNDRIRMEEEITQAKLQELARLEQRRRVHVARDEDGNPIDIRLWEIECMLKTDGNGRLMQRGSYEDANGYTFDPREIYRGEGTEVRGRGTTTCSDHAAILEARRFPQVCDDNEHVANGEQAEAAAENDGDADADECLTPEAFLDRERRWMKSIFAASRPEDISHLFWDAHSRFPSDFSLMVPSERVAWTEYMEIARTILLKKAEATVAFPPEVLATADATSIRSDARSGTDYSRSSAPTLDVGSNKSLVESSSSGACRERKPEVSRQDAFRYRLLSKTDKSVSASDTKHNYDHSSSTTSSPRSKMTTQIKVADWDAPLREGGQYLTESMMTAPEIILGRPYRSTTASGRDALSLFRFTLPSFGPTLTVTLEAACGNPTLFVARGRTPTTAEGADWIGLSSAGAMSVVRIFPQDPRYGPGKYYIGVRSMDIPSRFTLTVSSTSADDKISAHMRVAAAIVDRLTIMSNMDPNRLEKNFVGARLEAKDILQKRQSKAIAISCNRGGELFSPGNSGDAEKQQLFGDLRRLERQQTSPVNIGDDRIARSRSDTLLAATVSNTALVSRASSSIVDEANDHSGDLANVSSGFGSAPPDRCCLDRRQRRLLATLELKASKVENTRDVGSVGGRRLWATPRREEAPIEKARKWCSGLVSVDAAHIRYSIQRLPSTYSEQLRRGDFDARHLSLSKLDTGKKPQPETRRRIDDPIRTSDDTEIFSSESNGNSTKAILRDHPCPRFRNNIRLSTTVGSSTFLPQTSTRSPSGGQKRRQAFKGGGPAGGGARGAFPKSKPKLLPEILGGPTGTGGGNQKS